MKIFVPFLVIGLLLGLGSCEMQRKQDKVFDIVAGDTAVGLIRGVSLRDSKDKVKTLETLEIEEEKEDELYYFAALDPENKSSFAVYYNFDEFGLFQIQINVFPINDEQTQSIFNDFEKFLTERYGEAEAESNGKTWTTFSKTNSNVEVRLIDESEEYGKPFLSLSFFEPMPKED